MTLERVRRAWSDSWHLHGRASLAGCAVRKSLSSRHTRRGRGDEDIEAVAPGLINIAPPISLVRVGT